MKKFSRLVFAAFGLAILLYLTACEPETVEPKKVSQNTGSLSNDLVIASPGYLLNKRGTEVVEYDDSNRLKKVIFYSDYYISYNWYTQNDQYYLTTKTFFHGSLIKKTDYKLTSNNLCISSNTQYFFNNSLSSTKSLVYNYNAKGKLWWFYNPAIPQERTFFTYNALGDLTKIEENNYKGEMVKTTEFSYTNHETFTKKPDKYQFNVEWNELDFYPKIFGRFSEHLPMKIKVTDLNNYLLPATSYFYRYQFMPGGYVANRKTYIYSAGDLVHNIDYGYQMVVLGKK